jgi:pyridoxine 4-dehydrogenase
MCKGTIPIPGARNLSQAQSIDKFANLGALGGWRLSDGECRELEKASDMIPKGMTQNIFQTR